MNNTFGFNPNNLFFPFAYQFAHSTTNIYWCHPELFCNVVYPNLQIFLNNSTNSIVVTPPCAVPPDTKANEEEKQIAKKEEKKKESKDQKILGRKKRRVTKMCTACPHKYAMHYAKNMCSNCYHAKLCPPKPGFTLIKSTISISLKMYSSVLRLVCGFSTTAGLTPAFLICSIRRNGCVARSM